ncbi:hypothetical protein [Kitasatospora sp. NPDC059803]|uniref:hypothetical protein n=1 Tax=Kitasatospora sp. NPDC059803 TaxID=3346953 RepID=UPI0036653383
MDSDSTPRPPNLTSRIVLVTPELAGSILERNRNNRPVDKGVIKQISDAIARGEWQVTHQGIALAGSVESGRLLDGQHRLEAVKGCGVAVPMLIFEHVPEETFSVLDTGRSRSAGAVLALTGEKDYTLLAATVRHVQLYRSMPDSTWAGSASRLTNQQVLELFQEDRDSYLNAVAIGRLLGKTAKIIPTAAATGYYLTVDACPSASADAWIEGLSTGAGLATDDPRLALRNVLTALSMGSTVRRRTDNRGQLGLYIKAWNSWVFKKPVKALRFQQTEKMPIPVRQTPLG